MKEFSLLFSFLFILACGLRSQEVVLPEKKIYVSPEGKTFINRTIPFYMRLSTSPDHPGEPLWLKEPGKPLVASPVYFLREGYNSVRHPWAVDTVTLQMIYPRQTVVFEIYADSRPPKSTIRYGNTKTFSADGRIYVNGPAVITLEADDELSGVENLYYSLDGSPYSVYSSPLEMHEEREYLLAWYAVDHVGNAGKPKEVRVFPDLTPPQTTCEVGGDHFENILSGRSTIVLTSQDKGMGVGKIMYRIDSAAWRNYQLPVSMGILDQGEHSLTYYAVDLTGNQEEEKTFMFTVDKTPPVMVQELIGKSFIAGGKEYASGKTQIKITTFDNNAGVKEVYYSINNADFVRYEKPFYPSEIKGDLILRTYALDNVGNRSESTGQGESMTIPYYDLSGPVIGHDFTGPSFTMRDTVFICGKTGITLRATDSESGISRIEYAVDDSEPSSYISPFSLAGEGIHTIDITAYDNVENTGHHTFSVRLDDTGPEIFARFSILPAGSRQTEDAVLDAYPLHTVIFLSCTDAITGYDAMYYSLNGAPEKNYAAPIGSFSSEGIYTLNIRALDKLGNESLKVIRFALIK